MQITQKVKKKSCILQHLLKNRPMRKMCHINRGNQILDFYHILFDTKALKTKQNL